MAVEASLNLGTNPEAGTVPESAIENNNSGALMTILNTDTSTVTLDNAKAHALTKIGTSVLSAYPLVIGTDTTTVPEAQVVSDNTGNLLTVANSDTSTVTLENAKVHGLTKIGTSVFSAYPLVVGTDVGASFPVAVSMPAVNPSTAVAAVTGTTAGTIYWSMPFQGSGYKKAVVYLDGYENDTTTAQTLTFPTAFAYTPNVYNPGSVPGVTVSTTALSIDPDTTTKYTAWLIVEGF